MNHTATTATNDDSRDGTTTATAGPVANPRRTRLGADGRPMAGPASD